MPEKKNSLVCRHGLLRRSCGHCDAEDEVAKMEAEIEQLRSLAEFLWDADEHQVRQKCQNEDEEEAAFAMRVCELADTLGICSDTGKTTKDDLR